VAGSCEHGNEPSGSIRGEEVLDRMSNYQVLKKDLFRGVRSINVAILGINEQRDAS
jgi:hypothetical protein